MNIIRTAVLLCAGLLALSAPRTAAGFLCVEPIPPNLTFEPAALDFGSSPAGVSKTLAVSVTYNSNRFYEDGVCICRCSNPVSATITVPNNAPFSTDSGSFALSEGQSRTVQVTFLPPGTQSYGRTLNFTLSPGGGVFGLSVAGVGFTGQPNIYLNPTSFDFGNVPVTTTKNLSLLVRNEGTLQLTGSFATSGAPFSVASTTFSLAPGAHASVIVRFSPTANGAASGTLTVSSNDPDASPLNLTLNGYGRVPYLSVSSSSLDFGVIPTGESLTRVLQISNTSCLGCPDAQTLSLSSFQVSGSTFTFTGPTDASLAPGESATVNVIFSPTEEDTENGSLRFNSSDPGAPLTVVDLDGEARDSNLNPSTLNLFFGNVHLGTTATQTFSLRNDGTSTLSIGSVSSGSSRVTVTPTSATLAPGASQVFQARYTPTATSALTMHNEKLSANVVVSSNDSGVPTMAVHMTGRGVSPLIAAAPLDFGSVYLNDVRETPLVIHNDGLEPLAVQSIFSNNAQVTPLQTSVTVPPGEERNVLVRYRPATDGDHAATLTLSSNDAFNPVANIAVSGSGVPDLDLFVDRLEITQSIQNADNSLRLTAGKTAVARTFVKSRVRGLPNTSDTIRFVDGVLHVKKNGVAVPGSPLASQNGPIDVIANPLASRAKDTLNFLIPGGWLATTQDFEEWDFEVQVNPASGGRVARLKENDFGNNAAARSLTFWKNYAPRIDYIPIAVRSGAGVTYPLPPSSKMSEAASLFRKIFPVAGVQYVLRPPLFFNRDITYPNHHELTDLLFKASHLGSGPPPDRTYGWWPVNYRSPGGFIGIAEDIPGRTAMGGSLENMDEAQAVFAHEIGHTYGLCHTNYDNSCYEGYSDGHSTAHTSIGEVGFDVELQAAVASSTDFMKSHVGPNYWIHPQRHEFLFARLRSKDADPASARGCHELLDCATLMKPALLVSGSIAGDGSVALEPLYATSSIPDPGNEAVTDTAAAYVLQALDESGRVLTEYPLPVAGNNAFEGVDDAVTTFSLVVESVDGLEKVRVVRLGEDAPLAERAKNGHAPAIELTAPSGGTIDEPVLTVRWNASDADGDPLSFSVLYSFDGGDSFQTIGVDLTGSEFLYDVSKLPGSGRSVVRVVATDGFSATSADSPAFVVGTKTPVLTILSPKEGDTVFNGAPVVLEADANDLEDGPLPSSSVRWTSDTSGNLGSDSPLAVVLPVGTHRITAAAQDGDGLSDAREVLVHVVDGAAAPRPDAGPPISVDEEELVVLDASESADPDNGDALTYEWRQTEGPAVVLDNSSSETPTFTAPKVPADTRFKFLLTATDADGHIGTDVSEIVVQNVLYPSLRLSDTLLDFGLVDVGGSASRTLTISNEGNEDLEIADVLSSRPDFSVTPKNMTLTPGQSRTLTVVFQPGEAASWETHFRVVSNTVAGVATMVFLKGATPALDVRHDDNGAGGNLLPEELQDAENYAGNGGPNPDTSPGTGSSAGGCSLIP